jgi:hypothetical protein
MSRSRIPCLPCRCLVLLFVLAVPWAAAAEPRELLLSDGTVVGAIAVSPPPEWAPVDGKPETYQALPGWDGPWTRTVLGSFVSGPERPSGPPLELTLGKTVSDVPRPPRAAFGARMVALQTENGRPIVELRCPTTEVLASEDERTRVRVYRQGPSGERYVLEGWVDGKPEPAPWCQRVAYVDTGAIPDYWVRASARPPRFDRPAAFYKADEGRCRRWAFVGTDLVNVETTREGGCVYKNKSWRSVAQSPRGLSLGPPIYEATSTCGGLGGMGSSSDVTGLRLVSTGRGEWRWITQTAAQDPVAYHPDDVEVWYRSRRACESHLAARAKGFGTNPR